MSYLMINNDLISKQEYEATIQALEILNETINLYSKNYATTLFNIRKFSKFVKNTKELSSSSKKFIKCDNEAISGFQEKLKRNIIIAFFAYTPFLFEELLARLLYLLGLFFINTQIDKLRNIGKKMLSLKEDLNTISSEKSLINNYQ